IEPYRKALTTHGLAVQPEKQTRIWYTIASSLWRYFRGDPAVLFSEHGSDVRRVKEYIVSSKREFPYLSGPKLLNYWLYTYDYFVRPDITNRNYISVVPDVHVKRASVRLGLVSADDEDNTEKVAETWAEFLAGTPYSPCDLHAPLWRWSRAGFPDQSQLEARLSRL
ncbi:MAG TPA: hypothetical protein VNL71_02460, partial [Chloroflexota bacterium]|nr:hypothetical protein [Chloroflexota bacterium]